jgi:predicted nucleic acid-binding protein
MPAAEVLLESSVLVYALSDDPAERKKRDRAVRLIATEDFGTSYQVLMETWVVTTRKMQIPVPAEKVAALLERVVESSRASFIGRGS